MFSYWLCLIQPQPTGRQPDWVDVESVCPCMQILFQQSKSELCFDRPIRTTVLVHHVRVFLFLSPSFCLHFLPSPGEADVTDWSAFPKQTWKATAITAKSCSVLYLTVRVKADGGGNEWWFRKAGRCRGDFKAYFQSGIFSLIPHKEKTVITGSWHYFCLLKGMHAFAISTMQTLHEEVCTCGGVHCHKPRDLQPLYVLNTCFHRQTVCTEYQGLSYHYKTWVQLNERKTMLRVLDPSVERGHCIGPSVCVFVSIYGHHLPWEIRTLVSSSKYVCSNLALKCVMNMSHVIGSHCTALCANNIHHLCVWWFCCF